MTNKPLWVDPARSGDGSWVGDCRPDFGRRMMLRVALAVATSAAFMLSAASSASAYSRGFFVANDSRYTLKLVQELHGRGFEGRP